MPATIGIDLGASKCCVASVRDGKLEVLPNARGDKTTPSFVAFNDRRCLVGSDAKEQATLNPKNTVYGIKSILGRTYLDPVVRNYNRFSSANVVNVQGQPDINVEYRDRCMSVSPLLIAAMQILDMKQQAEREVGEVGGAVVSVPAYFGNSQREAIVAACQIAGLKLLDLISEPTATALTYRENRGRISGQETILVVDMGAAKLDVSVIRVGEQEVRVLAVCGDASQGGDNINEILMQYVDDKFDDTNNMSLLEEGRAMLKLKLACEEIKKKLTLLPYHKVQQESVLNQKDLIACLTRKKFEKLFVRKFSSDLKAIIESVLRSADLCKIDIDEVVVVGGSSRVPIIQTILFKFFGKKELNKTVNADESVATGAAILANELAKEEQHRKFVLHELVRMPMMDCSRGMFDFHKYVPSCQGLRFSVAVERTLSDGSTEREQTCLCPEKFGIVKIKEVVVKNPTTDNKKEEKTVAIINGSEVEEAKSQLETFVQDRIDLENDEKAQNDLEGYCYSVMEEIESFKTFFSEIDKVEDLSQTVLDWVDKNDRATVEECRKGEDRLRDTWRKFNEDFKKEIENYLAAIEASERSNETSEDVVASNEKLSTEEERTLGTEKTDLVETKCACAVCKKLETLVVEAREKEIEVARRLTELEDLEKKKLAVLQEIEKFNLEKKHQTDEKELTERQETEEKKLIEKQDAEKKKQEAEHTNLVKRQEAKNKKLASQLETLEKKQETESKKLAEKQETDRKKLAEQQEAKEKKLETEMKELTEQQEAKEKKLAESQRVEREKHKGDKNKVEQQQYSQEIKLAEQLENEMKKLEEEQEKERNKMTKEKEAVIEKMEAEKKKLAVQHQTEKKELEDEKMKVAEETKQETYLNRLVNQQKIERAQLYKHQEAAKKQLVNQREAEKEELGKQHEAAKKKQAERQETEKKKREEAEKKKQEEEKNKLEEQKKGQEEEKKKQEEEKKKQKEREAEKKKQEREAEKKKQEEREAEKKKQEEREAEKKKQEERETEKKKQEEREAEKKKQEEREAEKKKQNERETEKKKQEEREAEKKKQEREAEKKKQEEREAEKKKQEERDAEKKKQEERETEKKKQEKREAEKKKQEQEAEKKKQEQEAEKKKQEEQEAEMKRKDAEKKKRLVPNFKRNEINETNISVSENENTRQSSFPNSQSNCSGPQSRDSTFQSNHSWPQSNDSTFQSNGSGPQSNLSKRQSASVFGTQAFRGTSQNINCTFRENQCTSSKYGFGGDSVHPEPSSVAGLTMTQQENTALTALQSSDASGAPNSDLSCPQAQQTSRTGGSLPGELSMSVTSDSAKSVDSESPSSESGIHSNATSPSSSTSFVLVSAPNSDQDLAVLVDLDSDTSPGDVGAREAVLETPLPKGISSLFANGTSSSERTLKGNVEKIGVSTYNNGVNESHDKLKNKGDDANGENRLCDLD